MHALGRSQPAMGGVAGAARLAREGARRALPARVAPQLTVAQRRRINPPISVGQGLPGEQQLVAAPAAQRRGGKGSQPAGRALLGPHGRSSAAGGEGVAALGPGAGGSGSRRGGGGCGAAHPPPRPPPACGGAASWRGADTGGSRCLHRRGPAMARPQEAPQEPPFRLRIHPRYGNTPLFPSSSGGSRPQLPAARLPPRAQRPPPPSPGKDRTPPGPGRRGGRADCFPLPATGCVRGGGGRTPAVPLPLRSLCSALPPPSPARPPRPRLPPASSAAAGRMRCPARPARPPGNPGSAVGREGRREHLLRATGTPSVAEGTASHPRGHARAGSGCAGPGGGYSHGASSRPVGNGYHGISWVEKDLSHRRVQPMTEPSPCQFHHLPCPVFPYTPSSRVTPPPPRAVHSHAYSPFL